MDKYIIGRLTLNYWHFPSVLLLTSWDFMLKPTIVIMPRLSEFHRHTERVYHTLSIIAASFTVAKEWKQPNCPSIDDWIKKMWYVYTVAYYSALEKMKCCHLGQHGWSVTLLCYATQIGQKKSRTIRFHSYEGYETESNRWTRQRNKNSQTQTTVRWLPERKGGWWIVQGVRGVKYTVKAGELTLGGEHIIWHIDDAL